MSQSMTPPHFDETSRITRVLLKHPRDAFRGDQAIEREWEDLRFTAPPSFDGAIAEYDAFAALVASAGAEISWLPERGGAGLDSIYVRDASVVSPDGVILCHMGKPQRAWEPAAQGEAFAAAGVPVAGTIRAPGRLEGGDVVWLSNRAVLVGRGYRTNDEGIQQLQALVGPGVTVVTVPLPHWRGPDDVFHLMSILSPVADDLAVVYSPLMPVPLRELLLARGMVLVEVPEEEFDSMGANVLAIEPRRVVMVEGNPRTRARLESAGAEVLEYAGREISLKGGGGPTCLTRPLSRG